MEKLYTIDIIGQNQKHAFLSGKVEGASPPVGAKLTTHRNKMKNFFRVMIDKDYIQTLLLAVAHAGVTAIILPQNYYGEVYEMWRDYLYEKYGKLPPWEYGRADILQEHFLIEGKPVIRGEFYAGAF